MPDKSTPEEIRARFDSDVERFSNLDTGQTATMDSQLVLDLVTRAAAAVTPGARRLLDVGCGAGNYSLKLLGHLPGLEVTLLDLSRPMLDRALVRVGAATTGTVGAVQGDVRDFDPGRERYDIILAAAVLHHLRAEAEWQAVFARFFAALRPGGALWIADLVAHDQPALHRLMWSRYGDYLTAQQGDAYRERVFAYVEKEDTPRSLVFQLDALRAAGFTQVEVLHKNGPFAAFAALK